MAARFVICAVVWGLALTAMARAEGELAHRAPPARPADLIEISTAIPADLAPALAPVSTEVAAQPDAAPAQDPNRGAVTNLPLPRYVTLKSNEGNARRGPGLTHRIDWVFTRAGMPLRVTAEFEHWRRIEDQDGEGGWVHYSLLSGARSALVTAEMADFRDTPDDAARVAFRAESGVVGRLLECTANWCRMSVNGDRAWVRKTQIWGVDPEEIIE
jgi:SH3-like domain-containing protein